MQPKKLLLATLLCLSLPAFAEPPKQELRDVREAISSAQNDLKQKQAAHQRAQAALKASLAALEKARKELASLTQQQNIVWNRLQKLQNELEQVKTEVTGTKAQVSRLLASHYKNRRPNSISLFLKNAEPGQKARYLEYIKHVNEANEKVIQNLVKQQGELETHEKAIDAELTRLKKLKAAKQAALGKLGKTHSQAQQQSSELNNQIDNQTRKIAALRDDERRLNNLLADIARRHAANQKAKAQNRKKAAQARLAQSNKTKPTQPKSQSHTPATGNLTAEDRSLSGTDQSQSGAFSRMQGRLQRPVGGSIAGRFGQARPNGGSWRGVFFATPPTGVASIASGTIAYAGSLPGYGNTVVVDHGSSYLSVYTGLSSIAVGGGARVGAGSILGTSGTLPSGEQGLYLEIRYRNQPMNPLSWIR
ncbi:MAG: peptidoglycan DD-metalloendopeptidase family protein [Neisseria sp.]|uniref:murein hydrolase activator EnvC family protein n=1 Tax=Neisseria sp. TaxID=192066 RepID=UPI0026DCFFB5|nr:peptidoglycan DD-metalloendopeptidase family protein [Neisseria sp.]MDO4640094.1 peptidoglycan DD-metalloendopeptidase family protein [Neisseria sp.]